MKAVIAQRAWTDAELLAEGFTYYHRKKNLIMAGRLPETHAPLRIEYTYDHAYAEAGDVICFTPGTEKQDDILDYEHWSVKPMIFQKTYRLWDEPDWQPSDSEAHLMSFGCRPYYKHMGIWAKELEEPTYVKTLENEAPSLIPEGMWLAIGTDGDPWTMEPDEFINRYELPPPRRNRR